MANVLRAGGLRQGDRCVVMLPRVPQWQIAMVGCLRAGVIPIPCIEMLTPKDVRFRVAHSGARGEIVKAYIVLKPGRAASAALAAELQEHVKRVTAPYKYPREVEFVAELPKNASGKLLRRVLRDAEYARAGAASQS